MFTTQNPYKEILKVCLCAIVDSTWSGGGGGGGGDDDSA
jgi:hypothetical protein